GVPVKITPGGTTAAPGRAPRQRQRPSDSQCRYGFRPTLSLRILLAMRHGGGLPFHPRLNVHLYNNSGQVAGRRDGARQSRRPILRQTRAAGIIGGGTWALAAFHISSRMRTHATDQGGGKRGGGMAGQCAKLLFAHKERLSAGWTN